MCTNIIKVSVNDYILGQDDLHKHMGQIMEEHGSTNTIYVNGEIYLPTNQDKCRTLEQFMAPGGMDYWWKGKSNKWWQDYWKTYNDIPHMEDEEYNLIGW